jgi:Protein of unknown function (DUF1638)
MYIPNDTRVIACRVFEPELSALSVPRDRMVILDQGLHRYPEDLRKNLKAVLADLENQENVNRVILAYGYCGGGLKGLGSHRFSLVAPLAHDCVPVLLGRSLGKPAVECGAAFYLSPGWIDHGKTPLTEYDVTAEKFGNDDALWVGQQMLKGYSEVVLIETVARLGPRHRIYAAKMAELFRLGLRETVGAKGWLRRLLVGRASEGVAVMPPGRPICLEMYPNDQAAPGILSLEGQACPKS